MGRPSKKTSDKKVTAKKEVAGTVLDAEEKDPIVKVELVNTNTTYKDILLDGETVILYPNMHTVTTIPSSRFDEFKKFYETKYKGVVVNKRGF